MGYYSYIAVSNKNNKTMKGLGYYAMCKATKNLFQYEWGADDEFSIMNSDGDMVMKDPNEYEVLELFHSVASSEGNIEEEIIIEPKGRVLEWAEDDQPFYSAKAGAKAILTEDYTNKCEYVKVEFLDELANGQINGGYYREMFK